jgi:hypothetical protein
MALESSTYIDGLVATNPTGSDNIAQGDNHIRLLKSTIKATFPNIAGAVSGTHTTINNAVTAANAATDANTASTIVKRDASGNFTAGTITAALTGDVTGNASTATALATARTIGGVSFDGTANITLPGVNAAGTQSTSGNAATASALATARTISLGGDLSGSASFNGSANITITAAVADDSHNHIIANVDGLQTALNGKLATSGTAANSDKVDGYHIVFNQAGTASNTIYFRT